MREKKTFGEVKLFEGERTVIGFASVIGNVDDGGDLIAPGAYRKTLAERGDRLRWLWQHDMAQPPVAKIMEIAEVGREELPDAVLARYPEAQGALRVKREYLDTPRGNEILAGILSGALDEMSIGYDPLVIERPSGLVVAGRKVQRVLKEIRLWEGSDVNWGMNAATTNLKAALENKALAEWMEAHIHLSFSEVADELYAWGYVTREERIALSALIGDVLDAWNLGMTNNPALAGVRQRGRWDQASAEAEGDDTQMAVMAAQVMRLRQVALAQARLNLL